MNTQKNRKMMMKLYQTMTVLVSVFAGVLLILASSTDVNLSPQWKLIGAVVGGAILVITGLFLFPALIGGGRSKYLKICDTFLNFFVALSLLPGVIQEKLATKLSTIEGSSGDENTSKQNSVNIALKNFIIKWTGILIRVICIVGIYHLAIHFANTVLGILIMIPLAVAALGTR